MNIFVPLALSPNRLYQRKTIRLPDIAAVKRQKIFMPQFQKAHVKTTKAISDRLLARPSMPSIRLMLLTTSMTRKTVSG